MEVWAPLAGASSATGLMWQAHDTYFEIHPLLPAAVAAHVQLDADRAMRWEHGWVWVAGMLGYSMINEYESGRQRALTLKWAASEELNLRYALDRALLRGWWDLVDGVASGLNVSYYHSGRRAEWRDVLRRLSADATAPDGGPRPGRVKVWRRVALWELGAARDAGDLPIAIGWGDRLVEHWRRADGGYNLAVALVNVGFMRCLAGDARCMDDFTEALELLTDDSENRGLRAVLEFNIGLAYQEIDAVRDFDKALGHYNVSFDLQDPQDGFNRGKCAGQAGQLLLLAAEGLRDVDERRDGLLEGAAAYNTLALQLLPPSAVEDRAILLERFGNVHQLRGQWLDAFDAHRAARAAYEVVGNSRGQAQTRLAMAEDLRGLQRIDEAQVYAQAARAAFAALGSAGTPGAKTASRLLLDLER
jgi:hypothetical protein